MSRRFANPTKVADSATSTAPARRPGRRPLLLLLLLATALQAAPPFDLHRQAGGGLAATGIEGGGAGPAPRVEDGVKLLHQACRFTAAGPAREGWDLPVNLDLTPGAGLRLRVRCPDVSAISYFACYLRSGGGWYRAEFGLAGSGKWETVDLLKSATAIEGTPAGWRSIDLIRICAWRSGVGNTWFEVAQPESLPATPELVVARGLSAQNTGRAGELAVAVKQAKLLAELLTRAGLPPTFIDDLDLPTSLPGTARAIVLPYNPGLSTALEQTLLRFRANGGALVGFYDISERLQAATGIRKQAYLKASTVPGGLVGIRVAGANLPGAPELTPQTSWNINVMTPAAANVRAAAHWVSGEGKTTEYPAVLAGERVAWLSHVLLNGDPATGGKLLLAMVGHAWPGVWASAARTRLAALGTDVHPGGFAAAAAWLRQVTDSQPHPAAQARLTAAQAFQRHSVDLLRQGDHQASLRSAQAAETALRDTFFMVQPAAAGEFRGAWCHRGYGVDGWSWADSARRLREAGFTALIPNLANASTAWYPSQLLDRPARLGPGQDFLRDALAACRQYGLECHVWLVCFRLDDNTTPARLQALEAAGRLQRTSDGKIDRQWLCPSQPENRRHLLAVAAELLRTYPVDGLHLDFIRYPSSRHCHCDRCRSGFEQHLGRSLPNWPAGVAADPATAAAWQAFRVAQIDALVGGASNLRRQLRPTAKLSVAVFADADTARRSVAQDWPAWAARGWIDFVCPMNYTDTTEQFEQFVARQIAQAAGRIPVYPGIGVSARRLDSIEVVRQIGAARRQRTGGFILFEFNREPAETTFQDLAKGVTRP